MDMDRTVKYFCKKYAESRSDNRQKNRKFFQDPTARVCCQYLQLQYTSFK